MRFYYNAKYADGLHQREILAVQFIMREKVIFTLESMRREELRTYSNGFRERVSNIRK